MLLPGLGQLIFGRRRRGLVMLGITALLVIGVAAVAAGGAERLLAVLVQPDSLLALLVGNMALAVFRLLAALDAFIVVAQRRMGTAGRRLAAGVSVVALVLVTAAPHAVANNYGWRVHELLTTVFVELSPSEPETFELISFSAAGGVPSPNSFLPFPSRTGKIET
jgi:hypothetical protein